MTRSLVTTICILFFAFTDRAADPIVVSVSTTRPSAEISPHMIGLSYETSLMLPNAEGKHFFRSDNTALLNVFKTLGVKSLRIGGNSVDAAKIAVPSDDDVTSFFDFAKAADVKVIYSVRLQAPTTAPSDLAVNVDSASHIAKLIHDKYADQMDCFAIGNEPSYYKDDNYAGYIPKWKAVRDAILAVYPDAKFCGPDQNPSPELDKTMAHDFGNADGHLVQITQHSYPLGCAYKNYKEKDVTKLIPFDAADSREKMLAPAAYKTYEKIQKGIAGAIDGTPVAYRLSETNSYWFSGLKGASDSYASALWSVDYIYWWASHGIDGMNFHTGDRTGVDITLPCRYAVFVTAADGYEVRPLGYGLKLFGLGGQGTMIPATVTAAADQNLVAYATTEGKTVSVTLVNKAHGTSATEQSVQIVLDTPAGDSAAHIIYLRGKNDDISGGSADVTLGDAAIKEDGSWNGNWSAVPASAVNNNVITVTMPPASAAVVKIPVR